jgi:hypothetical protein
LSLPDPRDCNSVAAGTLQIQFLTNDALSSPLGVYYKIINGTAVDGTDFSTPATGEVTIATDTNYAFLNVPLVNETGGNIPLDCSFTYISTTSQSLTCTERPPSQVWSIEARCKADMGGFWVPIPGSDVTGDGTSTISECSELNSGSFVTDS